MTIYIICTFVVAYTLGWWRGRYAALKIYARALVFARIERLSKP